MAIKLSYRVNYLSDFPTFCSRAGWKRMGEDCHLFTFYVMLALGLNIVIGFAGLLDLGYVAFYAVGAIFSPYFHLHI